MRAPLYPLNAACIIMEESIYHPCPATRLAYQEALAFVSHTLVVGRDAQPRKAQTNIPVDRPKAQARNQKSL